MAVDVVENVLWVLRPAQDAAVPKVRHTLSITPQAQARVYWTMVCGPRPFHSASANQLHARHDDCEGDRANWLPLQLALGMRCCQYQGAMDSSECGAHSGPHAQS